MAHVNYLKEELKQRGLQLDVRAQKAGCMEVCEQGPTVALYPQGWFFRVMDTAACAVVADVAEGLVRGTIRAPGDLNPVAQSLRIDPAAVAHVQARAARSTPPV
jgi:(2Fe-2S) ferredoxin